MNLTAAALAISLVAAPAGAVAQDIAAGLLVFNKCRVCHSLGPGAKNKVGPVLNGIVGRPAATFEGYRYSPAMLASGLTWDEATLRSYLAAPKAVVPLGKMSFGGLKTELEIGNIISYLSQFQADGSPADPANPPPLPGSAAPATAAAPATP